MSTDPSTPLHERTKAPTWVFEVLLILVLLAGAYFRFKGLYWGEYQYLHPDERFLVWVGTDISPVKITEGPNGPEKTWLSFSEYFDTANSPLNPNNRGHGFYVYGTLPMFLTRLAVELYFGNSGFDLMTQAGRAFSALTDLLTVLLVYLIAARLYDKRVGVLAAAFSTAAVLQIQQSHFFTMDTFANLFAFLAFYFAIRIQTDKRPWPGEFDPGDQAISANDNALSSPPKRQGKEIKAFFRHPLFWPSLAFGLAYGMAMASKISIIPVAVLLPAAIVVRILSRPRRDWTRLAGEALAYLLIAGFVSLLVFRLTQPYAFSGPGFFGLRLNPEWVAQLREQRNQATPEVDFPPAMQWARRPIWFSAQNLVVWGLGLPLGILAWAGFLWAGWRMLKGDWQRHVLLWSWTGFYFIWQSLALNPTMRYQLPIYPSLVIFAAWAIIAMWDAGRNKLQKQDVKQSRISWQQIVVVLVGTLVLVSTFLYAFGFSGIYTRPITRVDASRWIYQNIPGPINLTITSKDGIYNQPLPFPYGASISAAAPYTTTFSPKTSGVLTEVHFPYVKDISGSSEPRTLTLTVLGPDGQPLSTARQTANFGSGSDARGSAYTLTLDPPIQVSEGAGYPMRLELDGKSPSTVLNNASTLRFLTPAGESADFPLFPLSDPQWAAASSTAQYSSQADGYIIEIFLPLAPGAQFDEQPVTLNIGLRTGQGQPDTHQEVIQGLPISAEDPRGPGYLFRLVSPIQVFANDTAEINLTVLNDASALALVGAGLANEGEWDDGLPLRVDGYDGFGGIYPLELNFNMYWDDTPDKLARFQRILDQSDYIVITSNRQWGSLPRIPERFPMTTAYYRSLLGCPPESDIVWCYRVAHPGMFDSELGFELIKVFQSDPAVGELSVNDQFAEEAFTVYDHPKVLVFKKTADYNPARVQEILGSIDFNKVIRLAPLKFGSNPADLQLPVDRWIEQQQGGTWSEIFNTASLVNRYILVSVVVWYLTLALLGLVAFPILRYAFPGLSDGGYPLARIAGLLLLSYLVWLAGSFQIPFTRTTITLMALLLLSVGGVLAYLQRRELINLWRAKKGYFFTIEALFLVFFIIDLLIRYGNPDLWHQWRGGEKPMDFAYLNAVVRSTSFPPYDPWFAGGYLNYYYYGFMLVGVLIKWLGIVPSVAYNLILPSIFAIIAMGAFSISWNLYTGIKKPDPSGSASSEAVDANADEPPKDKQISGFSMSPYWVGLAGALGMALLGNLGTVKMIYQGYQRLAAPGGVIEGANLITRLVWAGEGFFRNLSGQLLPFNIGDWYWLPSRAIPAPGDVEPITEFPFFTILYADLHAHLFAMPLALLALAFAASFVLARGSWRSFSAMAISFLMGGLAIGALKPTNTWDYYPYLALAIVAVIYTQAMYYQPDKNSLSRLPLIADLPPLAKKALVILFQILLLLGFSTLLYYPFEQWYGLGYSKIDFWQGGRTPISSYLTHWGLFLFVIVSWMIWETREWMANTPISALRKLTPYRALIIALLAGLMLTILLLSVRLPGEWKIPIGKNVIVALLVLPLAAWAGILILRPGQPDAKRFVLFLIGTGLTITLMVELIVLVGDIGRMNTVFKFYLQVWTLFAVSAAASLGWLLSALRDWNPGWRRAWSAVFVLLVAAAALYPLTASRAKILDRFSTGLPNGLDGMEYMQNSVYDWEGVMDLNQDYRAIRWMQENVQGTPVIVEANLRDLYRWGSRFSIYTGLPGVVGWEWHQQQQRALTPGSWISERIAEIDQFYTTISLQEALAFLRKYGVKYIIVGQLERNHYPGPGLDKFEAQDGILWHEVFRDQDTVIYEVNDDPTNSG